MLKVECKYRAKLELIESLLNTLESDKIVDIDDVIVKLKRSYWFYRNQLSDLDD